MKYKVIFLLVFVTILSFSYGCKSVNSVIYDGVQPNYQGSNAGKIAFFPLVVHLHPKKRTSIDLAVLNGEGVPDIVEKAVLRAFKEQPKVTGVSPAAVKSFFVTDPEPLEKVKKILKGEDKYNSSSPGCFNSVKYAEWYVHCISNTSGWQDSLLEFSKRAKSVDAVLFVVITELEKGKNKNSVNSIKASVAVLLVDTNTGRLIWSREVVDSLESGYKRDGFPDWEVLFSRVFSEPFWIDFPGRIFKNFN